jgi:hypothetical protein
MYEIINNPRVMTRDEIDNVYDGKWVYIVKAKFTPNESLIEGMPVVVGDIPYDGVDDGIYEQFNDKEYEQRYSHTLLDLPSYFISSVFNVG